MKIVVVGSLRNVPRHQGICERFVNRLGELIVERGHTLLTGCRSSLDKAIAGSAHKRLEALGKDDRQLVSYRLRHAKRVFSYGSIYMSSLKDWDLTHPELKVPEQIESADVAIMIAGSEGTYIAANWARIAHKPVLGIAQFGGAGKAVYLSEFERFKEKYARSVTREDFAVLNRDTQDTDLLAQDVISLAERIVTPYTVFTVMPFRSDFDEVFHSYQDLCRELGFEAIRTDKAESNEGIMQRIISGIRISAFVIADVTEDRPNVFYELGYAQGLEKKVVVTARTGTKLPFDISDVPVIFWNEQQDLKRKLRKRIKASFIK
jgi:hypothetical protein